MKHEKWKTPEAAGQQRAGKVPVLTVGREGNQKGCRGPESPVLEWQSRSGHRPPSAAQQGARDKLAMRGWAVRWSHRHSCPRSQQLGSPDAAM